VIKHRKIPVKIRRRAVVLLVVCVAAIVAAGLAGRGSGSKATVAAGPDSRTQPLADGCVRNTDTIHFKQAPNWVYVGGGLGAQNQVATGIVDSQYDPERVALPAGTDDPFTHTSYDFTFNIKVDPEYEQLLGTGNFEGQNSETARLHTERESLTFPSWAWPERGDRVSLIGSWVWDCDHYQPAGEHTEIHPFRLLWLERNPGGPSPRSAQGDREADLFVTTTETPADRHAVCALDHKADRPGFQTCVTYDVFGQRLPVPAATFVLKAAPKPSRSARLVYHVVDRGSDAPVSIHKVAGGVEVSFGRVDAGTIAKEVFVGWRPVKARPVHLRVRLRELLVRRAMDPSCPKYDPKCPFQDESILLDQTGAKPPGEWNVYVDAGGVWQPWNPILLQPHDGETFRTKQTIDLFVAKGKPWRLFVQTRECDFGSVGNAYSVQGVVAPCPHVLELGNGVTDDQPGIIAVHFRSPEASLGSHRVNSSLDGSTCPARNTKGCYRVSFTITRIRP
jgi:hypothetical protein